MSPLVVYFSQTGNTKFVAEKIAEAVNADIEEVVEVEKREGGFINIMLGGRDGMMGRKSKIKVTEKNPSNYDEVFIGAPVWGFNVAPAIRTYLSENKIEGKKLGLFCTSAGAGDKKLFSSIKELTQDCEVLVELSVH